MRIKPIIILSILLILGCSKDDISLIDFVPTNSALILDSSDINNTYDKLKESKFFKRLDSVEHKKNILSKYDYAISFLEEFQHYTKSKKSIMSIIDVGPLAYSYLFILKAQNIAYQDLVNYLKKKGKVSSIIYDGIKVLNLTLKDDSVFYFTIKDNVLFFTDEKIIVEDAIKNLNSPLNVIDNPNFRKIYKTANPNSECNIYVNYKYVSRILKCIFPKFDQELEHFADWTGLDLNIDDLKITMSGLTRGSDSIPMFINILRDTDPAEIIIDKNFPSNTSHAWVLRIGKLNLFQKKYSNYLELQGKHNYIKKAGDAYPFEPYEIFHKWFEGQIAGVYTNSKNKDSAGDMIAFVSSSNNEKALEELSSITDKNIIEYRGEKIYMFKYENILKHVFGNLYSSLKNPYFIYLDDSIVFSDNVYHIKNVIDNSLQKNSLGYSKQYMEFKNDLLKYSNMLFITKNINISNNVDYNLSKEYKNIFREWSADRFNNFKYCFVQASAEDKNFFTNVVFNYSKKRENEINQLWSVKLDNTTSFAPQLFVNHYTKKKEIFIQDDMNTIYLISNSGKILWKKNIKSPIIGNISVVDIYKNNKYQMVFNTADKLYIVDREGNYLDNFPIKIPSTTHGVSVFDYDKNRDYRFVIASMKDLYMYDKEGNKVKGFNFKGGKTDISMSPTFFRIKGKDYIVVTKKSGGINILNRRGEDRVKISGEYPLSNNPVFWNHDHWNITLNTGELLMFDTSGRTQKEKLQTLDNNHKTQNLSKGLLISNGNKIYFNKGGRPLEYTIDGSVDHLKAFEIGNSTYISFLNVNNNSVYLLDGDTNLIKGFPLYCNLPVILDDMDNSGILNLITTTKKGVISNYVVHNK
ncbi:hypothetical protein [Ichthyobacterium seriolicida]|uniref:Ribonuclease HII n=1 Tax=Ichthyobacterium seriolicida TaxID=242600 RepID=A0A1J1E9T8_9FLAO|nr:hypothetical protein [Ichthyobacterium seriolicida]BAV94683.1 ribonuclease HII [Ichthyobacterium seriolicida]